MAREVAWKLVVDETGAVKRMEEFSKEAEKTDKSVDKTKDSVDKAELSIRHLGSAFGSLKSYMGMALGAFGVTGVAFGVEDALKTTSSLVDETERFQATTGMGAQASLDYIAALKARGVGTEPVVKAYRSLGTAMKTAERQQYSFAVGQEKARMSGTLYTSQIGMQAEAFEQLGLSVSGLRSLSPEQQFVKVTSALEKMHGGAEKARIASQLFGRGGNALLPVLEKGALSLNHFREMAEKFFPTLGGKGVYTLEQLREKQAEAKMATEGLEFTFGTLLAPTISDVMGDFAGLISSIEKGHGVWGTLEKDASSVASAFGKILSDGEKVAQVLGLIKKGEHGKGKHHDGKGADVALDLGVGAAGIWGLKKLYKGGKAPFEFFKKLKLGGSGTAADAETGTGTVEGGAEFLSMLAGAAVLAGTAKGYKAAGELIHPGLFQLHTPKELEELMLRGVARQPGYGPTELGGTPIHGPRAREEARDLRLERIEAGNDALRRYAHRHHEPLSHVEAAYRHGQLKLEINIDGRRVAEAFVKNPNSQRYLGEAAEKAALQRNARR